MSEQDGIDWEALAKAAYAERMPFLQAYNTKAMTLSSRGITDEEWTTRYEAIMTEGLTPIARAVVAAYLEQRAARGVVEVRADDLGIAIDTAVDYYSDPDAFWKHPTLGGYGRDFVALIERLAAVAVPPPPGYDSGPADDDEWLSDPG